MARDSASRSKETLPMLEAVTDTITYVPGDGDPVSVKWGGHIFHANVPKEITGHPDGTQAQQLNHELLTAARSNPHFRRGSEKGERKAAREPRTPAEYRAHFVNWLRDAKADGDEGTNVDGLIARFCCDKPLQEACGCGSDDFMFMGELFMPKLHEFAKADGLNDQQVSAAWVNHGVNQLPW